MTEPLSRPSPTSSVASTGQPAKNTRVADAHRHTDTGAGGLPRWVIVAGLVLAIVLLLVLSMMLLGGGQGAGHVRPPH